MPSGAMSFGSSFSTAMKPGNDLAESSDKSISLFEPKTKEAVHLENLKYSPLVAHIYECYLKDKEAKYFDEIRALQAYRNFRGIYGPDVQFTSTEKSRIFVKETKMKVSAAIAHIVEVVFA